MIVLKNNTTMKNVPLIPPEVIKEIEDCLRECYGCGKCISGCPVAFEMDYTPAQILKLISLGEVETALKSKTIWVCSSCQTCSSRCPFNIDIPQIIDLLKQQANKSQINREQRATQILHQVFLTNIRQLGRVYEPGLICLWKIRTGRLFDDLLLGIKMFFKGKLPFFPEKIKGHKEVKKMFKSR